MKTPKFKLYTALICGALLLPNISLAYLTTGQTATKLTSDTVLYTVSYRFGTNKRELFLPIGAKRASDEPSPYLEYQMFDDEDLYELGSTVALVLTDDEDVDIVDGQYRLEPGEVAEFTLYAILTLSSELLEAKPDVSLLVTQLPFEILDDGELLQNGLNSSELQYYQTQDINF